MLHTLSLQDTLRLGGRWHKVVLACSSTTLWQSLHQPGHLNNLGHSAIVFSPILRPHGSSFQHTYLNLKASCALHKNAAPKVLAKASLLRYLQASSGSDPSAATPRAQDRIARNNSLAWITGSPQTVSAGKHGHVVWTKGRTGCVRSFGELDKVRSCGYSKLILDSDSSRTCEESVQAIGLRVYGSNQSFNATSSDLHANRRDFCIRFLEHRPACTCITGRLCRIAPQTTGDWIATTKVTIRTLTLSNSSNNSKNNQ